MGLVQLIEQVQRTSVSDDQGPWRQFVLDHLDYIALYSRNFLIEPELMNLYRFDLARFLKKYLKRHEDIAWIVLLLNQMKNDFEFVDITNLIVPDDSLITKLYHLYMTVSSNAR